MTSTLSRAALPTPASTRTARRRPPRISLTQALYFVGFLVVTAAIMLPVIIIVLTAFKPASEVNAFPPTLTPTQWTLDNFRAIFSELPFARLIGNSFVFAGGVTLFALVFDSLAAYALARLDFRGSKVLLIVIIASLMIPFQATLIPIYQLVSDLGWVNTFAGLILPRAADAFGIFFLRQFFLSLPRDLDNAARIDGASEFRVFWSVVLPNAIPALLTLGIFTFVNNWNDLLWPLVFTTESDHGTITSGLTLLTGPGGIIPQGVMMAGALIAVLPLAILFLLVQRRFIESVASSGLK
ncbi:MULTISPECIES: carbohydrate ABC transporter permease [unclassified Cryobacterium]|uniref:carbohydrate ABC transporter permease n=1 Tax=unclassified Cryobacterium TaxID=2649013 RepID=UPI00106A26DB|nr:MULTISPECIES: carbohydrate ABC transporter permease [unclassified Cryobacterium]TFC50327.1 carbohydrate ABC transporter permease [Cryobacterium sp. TMB3-1-2]TFC71939.1 carbohydrate ABC transporter permease [Cryobacterium sp. TMB3-15]TFC78532.1 carbohydrate ABC transporter permease [Cryobacterium sp. TMB3-10]TFD44589.1 carbohydrate ABC transporter permease [Cryobacterium sp. TMB3-12]